MTYKQFRAWCNDRACDGQWGINTAMACISIMDSVESVKAPGFHLFRKRANNEAKEKMWQKLNSEWEIEEIFCKR